VSDPRDRIHAYVSAHLRGVVVGDEDDLFAKGWVTSLFAMQLVTFLEDSFGLVIDNDDLVLDNFRSVARMAALVERITSRGEAS
jgi:methoxymalonate biosynthesis acyl carrier protein